jgi:hypothetical protein
MKLNNLSWTKKGNVKVMDSWDLPHKIRVTPTAPFSWSLTESNRDDPFATVVYRINASKFFIEDLVANHSSGLSASQLGFPTQSSAVEWAIRLYFAAPFEANEFPVWEEFGPPKGTLTATQALQQYKISMIKNIRVFGFSLRQAKIMVESLAQNPDEVVNAAAWDRYDLTSLKRYNEATNG